MLPPMILGCQASVVFLIAVGSASQVIRCQAGDDSPSVML